MPNKQKYIGLAAVLALHILVIAWLVSANVGPLGAPEGKGVLYVAYEEASAKAPPSPPPPVLANPLEPFDPDIVEPELVITAPMPAVGLLNPLVDMAPPKPKQVCDATPYIIKAFLANSQTQDALLTLRRLDRIDTNVVGIWNGGWPETQEIERGQAYALVRSALGRGLMQAPEACLSEPMRGIRIVFIPYPSGLLGMLLGSERWTWEEVVAP